MRFGIAAVTAPIALRDNWRRDNVDISVAAVFGLFGVASTCPEPRLGAVTSVTIQLAVFALVMYTPAWRMLKPVRLAVPASRDASVATSGSASARPPEFPC
ncbi:MAG: hypothetical protein IV085_03050 [Thiobacillus sp.]|nr:hypothetical protein [Thiobacillus sp.]